MITAHTTSADETRALAAALAKVSTVGDLLVLAGELGAGKTAFAQGYGKAMGVGVPITSPTFTLANHYDGDISLNHLDVYRLEQLDEIKELGLYELIDGEGITLIEWGDAITPVLGADFLEIRLVFGEADDDRVITIHPVGSRWLARSRALADAVAPWSTPETI